MRWLATAATLATLAVPSGAAPPNRVTADIAEWSIVPSAGMIESGKVEIVAHNFGQLTHQLVVVRTARFGQALAVRRDRAVGRQLAAPITVPPGTRRSIVVRLRPGSYVVLDNLPGHYRNGAWAAIAVR
jgi:uncharacterized cupredoxin-like copper-binding protein